MTNCRNKGKEFRSILLYFVIGIVFLFLMDNTSGIRNMLCGYPEKSYTADQIVMERWEKTGEENVYCSDDDPTMAFFGFNGYVHSVFLNLKTVDATPAPSVTVYWTDETTPEFTEGNSAAVSIAKHHDGYLCRINQEVVDFRLDLYDDSGNSIKLNGVTVNSRDFTFPVEFVFPMTVIGLMFAAVLLVKPREHEDTAPAVSGRPGKIEEIEFVRAVCSIGLVAFHLSMYTGEDGPRLLYTYANGDFGNAVVGIFLIISGGVLFYNHKDVENIPLFYYKRWKSIFPAFYIAFLYFFINAAMRTGEAFYLGSPWPLLYSLIGMDGYFLYRTQTYYMIGEWFLGAIIFLYLLYPLLAKCVRKLGWGALLGMILLLMWQLKTDAFLIHPVRNLIYCSTLFVLGMLIFKYELFRKKSVQWASAIISILLLFCPIRGFDYFKVILLCGSLLIVLLTIGKWVMKLPFARNLFGFIGGLSFTVFLVQNQIGTALVASIQPCSRWQLLKTFVMVLCLCIAMAWCIQTISKAILNTGWYRRLENALLKKISGGKTHDRQAAPELTR